MFLSTYEPKLDAKGRVSFPAELRSAMEGGIVVTRGHENCLYAIAAADFEEMVAPLLAAPMASKQARDYRRFFLSGASKEVPDKQGRIGIPSHLRAYAGLEQQLVIVGVGNYVEIWDSERWKEYNEETVNDFSGFSADIDLSIF